MVARLSVSLHHSAHGGTISFLWQCTTVTPADWINLPTHQYDPISQTHFQFQHALTWTNIMQTTSTNTHTHVRLNNVDRQMTRLPVGERGGLPSRCRPRQNPKDRCSCPRRADQDHWRTTTDRQTKGQSRHQRNILSYR